MPYKSKSKQKSIAHARKVKWFKANITAHSISETELDSDSDSGVTVTAWTGCVNNHLIVTDDSGSDSEWESNSSDDEVDELEGDELVESLQREIEHEIQLLQELEPTPSSQYERLKTVVSAKEWEKAEQNRGLGYTGRGKRTQRKQRQEVRENAEKAKIVRKR
jgi:predicted Mrr-cat superfamily restriction endonuclease